VALTPEQRALLELVQDHGLTDEEIGELTGEGAEAARSRLRAAQAARRPPLGLALALAGLALVAGVLALVGVFSGDGLQVGTPLATEPVGGDQEVARIELAGTARSGAQGSVVIGIGGDQSPYLDFDLGGLEPAPGGGFHMLWVEVDDGRGVPLPDPIAVAADGSFRGRLSLPLETAGILEVGRALEVIVTDRQAIGRVTREATRAERTSRPGRFDASDLPKRPGEAVLRGRFPN
jgi:hypothetical protein